MKSVKFKWLLYLTRPQQIKEQLICVGAKTGVIKICYYNLGKHHFLYKDLY